MQGKIRKFLSKLFSILDIYQNSIAWDVLGECVVIKDQQKVEKDVIPCHFSLKKFSSFVRQLHLYNFHKRKSKDGSLVFFNPCFLRQQRYLATKIIRKRKTKAQLKIYEESKSTEPIIEQEKLENNNVCNVVYISKSKAQAQDIFQCGSLIQIQSKDIASIFNDQDPYDILNFI